MDVRTLFLAQTCALLASAAMLWIARGEADRRNGLRLWMLAVAGQGLAYALLSNAGRLPSLLSAGLGNALGAVSVALFHAAIRQFLGQTMHRTGLGLMASMVLAVTAVALTAGADYAQSTIFNGFAYGLVQLLNAWLLWRSPAPTLRGVQRVVAGFYLLMGLLLPLRAAALLLQQGQGRDYLNVPADWQAPLFLFGFLFIIVTTLGFLQMCKMQAEAEVRQQAHSDGLTGLPNRRALDEAVAAAIAQARPFALLLVDLDHFKAINDGFGHHAGDAALADFAAGLRASLAAGEQGFRWGGEEFCLLLPAGDAGAALARARQLHQEIARPPRGELPALRCSLGLTLWQPGDSADTLFRRADRALYRAKSLGRNRVELG